MRIKVLAVLFTVMAVCAVTAATAGAVATSTPGGGRIGYLPLNEEAKSPSGGGTPIHGTYPNGYPPLEYWGGPVMHSHAAYAIFWAPSGYSFPAGYASAIDTFLKNVAADSRKSTNVYSVSTQYTDETGRATYSDSYGGSFVDKQAYPTANTCPLYSGVESFSACVSDERMEEEVESVVAAQGWPSGLSSEYYVVLPPQVGSCFDEGGTVCFDRQFCAYHSYTESTGAIYANISYSPGDVEGCGVGEYPSGHSNGNVDDTLSSLSHEANESITDPYINAWLDERGNENGDECRNSSDDYGDPLGGSGGSLFNEEIGSGHYYLQQEWSNNIFDCAQRAEPASPVISGPAQLAPGQPGGFSASSSAPGESELVSFNWKFGDGGTASGETVSHAFGAPGTFSVALEVEDEWGLRYSTSGQVTVAQPPIVTPVPPPVPPKKRPRHHKALKCRKGFHKAKRKHGKAVCVKTKRHHHRHRRH